MAAIIPDNTAAAAWRAWQSATDIHSLSPESHKLLPMLYWNLRDRLGHGPVASTIKGVYRHTWYRNHQLCQALSTVLGSLRDSGVQPVLLDDIALMLFTYPAMGSRMLADAAIAVGEVDRVRNMRAPSPWTVSLGQSNPHPGEPFARWHHPLRFSLKWLRISEPPDHLQRRSLNGKPVMSLTDTEQLARIMAAPVERFRPALDWLLDIVLLSRHGEIDWYRWHRRMAERGLEQRAAATLEFLTGFTNHLPRSVSGITR